MSRRRIFTAVAAVAFTLAVLLAGFLIFAAFRGVREDRVREMQRAQRDEEFRRRVEAERAEGRAEAVVVFAEPTRPAPDEAAEFTAVFDALGGALAREDANAVRGMFDVGRMFAEMERIGAFERIPEAKHHGFQTGARQGLESKLGEALVGNPLVRWQTTDVRHLRWSADRREVVVIAVHRSGDADDLPLRCRWWLARDGAGWKVYDLEDMLLGMRQTRVMASMMTPEMINRIRRDPLAVQTAVGGVRDAMVHIGRQDVNAADLALAPARDGEWPPAVRALIELIEGAIVLGRGDPDAALARFDAAERLLPNVPGAVLARGSAYVALGRLDDALAAVRAYQKEVGPDSLSLALEGSVYEAQGKTAEAATAFRKALDEAPADAAAFDGLRRTLPTGQKKELGERFARLKDPRKAYSELVGPALRDNDDETAGVLLDALLKAQPDDPRGLADDVRRKVKAEQFTDAKAVMVRGLKAADEDDRDTVLSAYLYAMRGAGKALDGYAAVPAAHARAAFRNLAGGIDVDIDDPDTDDPKLPALLSELVAVHRKREPNDPWAWFYEAAVHQHAGEYEKAEKLLAAGAAKLPPKKADAKEIDFDGDRFRAGRVECLFKLKKGSDAYRDLGPPDATFRQLAELYDDANDLTGLAELLTTHRKRVPDDGEWVFWQAHLHFRKESYTAAIPLFKSYQRDAGADALSGWRARDELIRAQVRTKPADARRTLDDVGAERVNAALRAAIAAALDDRAELERLLAESARNGKTWFYTDADFRRAIAAEKYRDLRVKYPDPNPPKRTDG